MACGGCNTSIGLTKDQVENLIQKLIDEGKLQLGLTDCEGIALGKGSKVLLCSVLAVKVNDLIKKGAIDVVTDVTVEDGKLVVTDGTGKSKKLTTPFVSDLTFDATTNKLKWVEDGKNKEATLQYVKAVTGNNGVTLTLPDGSTVEVPKVENTLSPDNLDHTIQKDANVPNKFGVKVDPKGGLATNNINGIAVKTSSGITKDKEGNVTINTGDGIKIQDDKVVVDNDFINKLVESLLVGKPFGAVPVFKMSDLNKHEGTVIRGEGQINDTSFGIMKFDNLPYNSGNVQIAGFPVTQITSGYTDSAGFFIKSGGELIQVVLANDELYWRVNDGHMGNFGVGYMSNAGFNGSLDWGPWKLLGGTKSPDPILPPSYTSIIVKGITEEKSVYRSRNTKVGGKVTRIKSRFNLKIGTDIPYKIESLNLKFNSNAPIIGIEPINGYMKFGAAESNITFGTNLITVQNEVLLPNIPFILDFLVEVDSSSFDNGDEIEVTPVWGDEIKLSKLNDSDKVSASLTYNLTSLINSIEEE